PPPPFDEPPEQPVVTSIAAVPTATHRVVGRLPYRFMVFGPLGGLRGFVIVKQAKKESQPS
ncbi:hypothetical protein, partial [Streptomyces calidiresistens]|uniref:hypothetical protein n=1 Tax=Streptomyces calidiresistens TaxID=1485586 RepID=UPI001E3122AF